MKISRLERRKRLTAKTPMKRSSKPLPAKRLKARRVGKPKRKEWMKVIDGREVLDTDTTAGRAEYTRRTYEMAERQGGLCPMCRLGMSRPTFDHENGRGAGKRDDRIWIVVDGQEPQPLNHALCWTCNTSKGSQRIAMPYYAAKIRVETI